MDVASDLTRYIRYTCCDILRDDVFHDKAKCYRKNLQDLLCSSMRVIHTGDYHGLRKDEVLPADVDRQ